MKPESATKRWLILIPVVVGLLAGGATFYYAKDRQARKACHEVRAGFDVGSSSTKVVVAEVNICKGKVMRVLLDESKRVPYQEDFQKNGDIRIGPEVIKSGIAVLNDFRAQALARGANRLSGYATSVFRRAQNGRDVVDEITRATGINLRVVSQDEEGHIGFRGVQSLVEVPTQDLVVWDIGGGSQQLMMAESDRVSVFKGTTASVGFRDIVISQVKKADPKEVTTPNPLSAQQVDAAVNFASDLAKPIGETFRERLRREGTVVVGIGGVHVNSIQRQAGVVDEYTQEDLKKAIDLRIEKPDDFFDSEYADTELTNLILVYGLMKEIGIEKVRPLKVNLALGAVVDTQIQ